MIICVCARVSERDLAREVHSGCPDFATLQFTLGVATGCGTCREFAEAAFAEHAGGPAAAGRPSRTGAHPCSGCVGAAHCSGMPLAA